MTNETLKNALNDAAKQAEKNGNAKVQADELAEGDLSEISGGLAMEQEGDCKAMACGVF